MTEKPAVRISLIIPAYNEQAYLPVLLDTIDIARHNYVNGSSAIEVIVSDNNSTDKTAEIAQKYGCRVVKEKKRIIAAVRNAGAAAARGEILMFIDADSQIHPNTFNVIDHAMLSSKIIAGATGVHMERMSPGIAAAYMIMVPMVWITGMDTGVVFCRRADFEAIGGYNEHKLFAEDVDFLWKLKILGSSRGQRLTRITAVKAITSTRKFDQHGDWHYFSVMAHAFFAICFSSKRVQKFVKNYWYDDLNRDKDAKNT